MLVTMFVQFFHYEHEFAVFIENTLFLYIFISRKPDVIDKTDGRFGFSTPKLGKIHLKTVCKKNCMYFIITKPSLCKFTGHFYYVIFLCDLLVFEIGSRTFGPLVTSLNIDMFSSHILNHDFKYKRIVTIKKFIKKKHV